MGRIIVGKRCREMEKLSIITAAEDRPNVPRQANNPQTTRGEPPRQFKKNVRRCLKIGNVPNGEGFFSPDEANLTQEYLVYSKENWQSMAEKEPPFGYVDNFQTSPSSKPATSASSYGLSCRELAVYGSLRSRAGSKDACWPSMQTMAAACGCSDTTARRAVDELERRGHTTIKNSVHRSPRQAGHCQSQRLSTQGIYPDPRKAQAAGG